MAYVILHIFVQTLCYLPNNMRYDFEEMECLSFVRLSVGVRVLYCDIAAILIVWLSSTGCRDVCRKSKSGRCVNPFSFVFDGKHINTTHIIHVRHDIDGHTSLCYLCCHIIVQSSARTRDWTLPWANTTTVRHTHDFIWRSKKKKRVPFQRSEIMFN